MSIYSAFTLDFVFFYTLSLPNESLILNKKIYISLNFQSIVIYKYI